MAKIFKAEVGSIVKDKYGNLATVVKSSKRSFTVKYEYMLHTFIYGTGINPETIEQCGFTLVATHNQVMNHFKIPF